MVVDGHQARIGQQWVLFGWLARQMVATQVGGNKAPKYDEQFEAEFERLKRRRRLRQESTEE